MKTERIHHVSAIVGPAQETFDFYTKVLGLDLIKKTVNFDDMSTYHLYFGDRNADPGFAMTLFNWDLDKRGRVGSGQVGVIAFSVGKDTLSTWQEHLANHDVASTITNRFNRSTLEFEDRHGLALALVEDDTQTAFDISGFYGIEILSARVMLTNDHLTKQLGLRATGESPTHYYFETVGAEQNVVAVNKKEIRRGIDGVGTVHHVAWQATNEEELKAWQKELLLTGSTPTEVKDRKYFSSIYYREPGFTIYEIATAEPGFLVDEAREALGSSLKLPQKFERYREKIEAHLTPIKGA